MAWAWWRRQLHHYSGTWRPHKLQQQLKQTASLTSRGQTLLQAWLRSLFLLPSSRPSPNSQQRHDRTHTHKTPRCTPSAVTHPSPSVPAYTHHHLPRKGVPLGGGVAAALSLKLPHSSCNAHSGATGLEQLSAGHEAHSTHALAPKRGNTARPPLNTCIRTLQHQRQHQHQHPHACSPSPRLLSTSTSGNTRSSVSPWRSACHAVADAHHTIQTILHFLSSQPSATPTSAAAAVPHSAAATPPSAAATPPSAAAAAVPHSAAATPPSAAAAAVPHSAAATPPSAAAAAVPHSAAATPPSAAAAAAAEHADRHHVDSLLDHATSCLQQAAASAATAAAAAVTAGTHAAPVLMSQRDSSITPVQWHGNDVAGTGCVDGSCCGGEGSCVCALAPASLVRLAQVRGDGCCCLEGLVVSHLTQKALACSSAVSCKLCVAVPPFPLCVPLTHHVLTESACLEKSCYQRSFNPTQRVRVCVCACSCSHAAARLILLP